MFKKKVVVALIATLVVISILAAPVFAANGNNRQASGERPGWGYGDNNHDHTAGPPGQANKEP